MTAAMKRSSVKRPCNPAKQKAAVACQPKKKPETGDAQTYKGFIDGTNVETLEARLAKPPIASNKSGYNGVYKNSNGMWIAQITFRNKTYYLGSFTDIRDAISARKQGEKVFENFLGWYYSTHSAK